MIFRVLVLGDTILASPIVLVKLHRILKLYLEGTCATTVLVCYVKADYCLLLDHFSRSNRFWSENKNEK